MTIQSKQRVKFGIIHQNLTKRVKFEIAFPNEHNDNRKKTRDKSYKYKVLKSIEILQAKLRFIQTLGLTS